MPLKLADINSPASTNIVNKWADGQENAQSGQLTQIQSLQNKIASLQSTVTQLSKTSTTSTSPSPLIPAVLGTFTVPGAVIPGGVTNTFPTGILCNATDAVGWCFQATVPGVLFIIKVQVKFTGGGTQIVVLTENTSASSQTFPTYIINYRIN